MEWLCYNVYKFHCIVCFTVIAIICQGTADGNLPLAKFGTMHEMETFMLKLCMVPFQINCKKINKKKEHNRWNQSCFTKDFYGLKLDTTINVRLFKDPREPCINGTQSGK